RQARRDASPLRPDRGRGRRAPARPRALRSAAAWPRPARATSPSSYAQPPPYLRRDLCRRLLPVHELDPLGEALRQPLVGASDLGLEAVALLLDPIGLAPPATRGGSGIDGDDERSVGQQ